jgi:hypothetical protein
MTRRQITRYTTTFLILLGLLLIVRTATAEGPSGLRAGYLIGAAVIVIGVARAKIAAAHSRDDEPTSHDPRGED